MGGDGEEKRGQSRTQIIRVLLNFTERQGVADGAFNLIHIRRLASQRDEGEKKLVCLSACYLFHLPLLLSKIACVGFGWGYVCVGRYMCVSCMSHEAKCVVHTACIYSFENLSNIYLSDAAEALYNYPFTTAHIQCT